MAIISQPPTSHVYKNIAFLPSLRFKKLLVRLLDRLDACQARLDTRVLPFSRETKNLIFDVHKTE